MKISVCVSDEGDGCGRGGKLYTPNLRERACVDVFAGHGVVGALGHVAVGVGPAVLQAVGAEAAALQKKRRKGGWAGGTEGGKRPHILAAHV